LVGIVISGGLAKSQPLLVVLLCGIGFAIAFVLVLRWLARLFASTCFGIRAKKWVRNFGKIDTDRFPEKKDDERYLRERLGQLTDGTFDSPALAEYLRAAGLIAVVPMLFLLLVVYRLYFANGEGATDMLVVVGVSTVCAVLATIGAALGATGHILREEARIKTAIHRRFPTPTAFQDWQGTYQRSCERLSNERARAINAEIRRTVQDGDSQWAHAQLVIPRPFPTQPVHSESRAPEVESDLLVTP
jgi:hypothetical protein